jgi:DNA polymerase-3 subunit alpha
MLGLYVSDHPLMGVEAALRRVCDVGLAELRDAVGSGSLAEGSVLRVGGVITGVSTRWTKRGALMATFSLEDLEAAVEVFVFPRVMDEYGPLLENDALACLKARVDTRDDMLKLVCLELSRPELGDGAEALKIALPVAALTESNVERLKGLLTEHPGDAPVSLVVGESELALPEAYNVNPRGGLVGSLRELFGAQAALG